MPCGAVPCCDAAAQPLQHSPASTLNTRAFTATLSGGERGHRLNLLDWWLVVLDAAGVIRLLLLLLPLLLYF